MVDTFVHFSTHSAFAVDLGLIDLCFYYISSDSLFLSGYYEVPLPPNILYSEFQCLGRILAFFSFLVRYFAFSIEISRVFKMYDFRFVLSSDFQSFLTHLRFFIFLLITSD